MRSIVYVTVGRPSVRLSVPSIDSSNGGRRVCCWASGCKTELWYDLNYFRDSVIASSKLLYCAAKQSLVVRVKLAPWTSVALYDSFFLFSRIALNRSRTAVSRFLLRPTDSLLFFNSGRINSKWSDIAPMKTCDCFNPEVPHTICLARQWRTSMYMQCFWSYLVMFAETVADNSRWCLVTKVNLGFTDMAIRFAATLLPVSVCLPWRQGKQFGTGWVVLFC